MKSVLISIKPKYVAKILNGEKTIEIRKIAPKCELPIDVYIYCTKPNDRLFALGKMFDDRIGKIAYFVDKKCNIEKYTDTGEVMNGKVLAKFTLREVEDGSQMNSSDGFRFINEACISYDEFLDYLYKGKEQIFGWHISDLVIFDRPKELTDFVKSGIASYETVKNFASSMGRDYPKKRYIERCKQYGYLITKAPQSWCYCEEVRL